MDDVGYKDQSRPSKNVKTKNLDCKSFPTHIYLFQGNKITELAPLYIPPEFKKISMETESIDSTFSKYKKNKKWNNKLIFLHFQKKNLCSFLSLLFKKLQIVFSKNGNKLYHHDIVFVRRTKKLWQNNASDKHPISRQCQFYNTFRQHSWNQYLYNQLCAVSWEETIEEECQEKYHGSGAWRRDGSNVEKLLYRSCK